MTLSKLLTGLLIASERHGITKLKHPCFPGFAPVTNETQAVAVIGGMVDLRVSHLPFPVRAGIVLNTPTLVI